LAMCAAPFPFSLSPTLPHATRDPSLPSPQASAGALKESHAACRAAVHEALAVALPAWAADWAGSLTRRLAAEKTAMATLQVRRWKVGANSRWTSSEFMPRWQGISLQLGRELRNCRF